jgi:hypothetical protein
LAKNDTATLMRIGGQADIVPDSVQRLDFGGNPLSRADRISPSHGSAAAWRHRAPLPLLRPPGLRPGPSGLTSANPRSSKEILAKARLAVMQSPAPNRIPRAPQTAPARTTLSSGVSVLPTP